MKKKIRYTVIGAGHGGKAMAAHLALMDFPVSLYNRTSEHIFGVKARGGIDLESYDGGPRGFGKLEMVTSDIGEALALADVIMVVVPSSAQERADRAPPSRPDLRRDRVCKSYQRFRL
jgi:opine dehydrogenase